jgi:hypothetical protein
MVLFGLLFALTGVFFITFAAGWQGASGFSSVIQTVLIGGTAIFFNEVQSETAKKKCQEIKKAKPANALRSIVFRRKS